MAVIKRLFSIGLLLLAAAAGAGKAYIEYAVNQRLQNVAAQLGPELQFRYATAYLAWPARLVIKNPSLRFADGSRWLADYGMVHDVYRFYRDPPRHWQLSLEQLAYQPVASASAPPPWLTALGYSAYYLSRKEWQALGMAHWRANIDLQADWQAEQGRLQVQAQATGLQIGQLALQFSLEQLPPKQLNQWLQRAALRELQLDYRNPVPLRQALRYLARRNQQPPDALQAGLAAQVSEDLRAAGLGLQQASLNSLQRFLQNPHHLHIGIAPPQPLRWDKLRRSLPSQWVRQLGLSLHNET